MNTFHPAEPLLREKHPAEMELRTSLNHAAMLLAVASDKVRCVDFEGDRFDLLAEAERFDEVLERTA